jgi:hypothetical protein
MKHCPDCGGKVEKSREKSEKHLGTTTAFKCEKCEAEWISEWNDFDQQETIYRSGSESADDKGEDDADDLS